MLEIYLRDEYKQHWPEIEMLAHKTDAASRRKLRAYALEACRLSTQSYGLFRRVGEPVTVTESGKTYNLKPGDNVFVNLVYSHPSIFLLINIRFLRMSIQWH